MLAGCAAPPLARRQAPPVPLNRPDLQRYIAEVGKKISGHSGRRGWTYDFDLDGSEAPLLQTTWDPSARRGSIRISAGLLRSLANEAELAFVLGREIAHVGEAAQPLSYPQQKQADRRALEWMVQAGYDPVAVYALLRRLGDREGEPGWSEYLSSLPPREIREGLVREFLEEKKPARGGLSAWPERFRQAMADLPEPPKARSGPRGRAFYDPEFGFRLAAPPGWRWVALSAEERARHPDLRAVAVPSEGEGRFEVLAAETPAPDLAAFVSSVERKTKMRKVESRGGLAAGRFAQIATYEENQTRFEVTYLLVDRRGFALSFAAGRERFADLAETRQAFRRGFAITE